MTYGSTCGIIKSMLIHIAIEKEAPEATGESNRQSKISKIFRVADIMHLHRNETGSDQGISSYLSSRRSILLNLNPKVERWKNFWRRLKDGS